MAMFISAGICFILGVICICVCIFIIRVQQPNLGSNGDYVSAMLFGGSISLAFAMIIFLLIGFGALLF